MGQLASGGTTYVLTPTQWPQSDFGTWISWYDNASHQVQNNLLTSISGTSSALIPATANSSAYIFLGQSSNGGNAIIPITFLNGAPVVDISKPIQYFSAYWADSASLSLAGSFSATQQFLANSPLQQGLSSYDHTVEAQVGDLNGDGLPDVIATQLFEDPQSFTYGFGVYFQNTDGTFRDVSKTAFTDFQNNESGPYKIYLADINHDCHLDIVWGTINFNVNLSQGLGSAGVYALANAAVYLNDGLGNFIRGSTDQALFDQFQNRQIAVVPLANGGYDLATFDSTYNVTPQFTASLYQGINNYTGPNGVNPATRGAAGFNEWYYLNRYADAASAVLSGQYHSGLDYYLAIGHSRGDEICAPNTKIYGSIGVDSFKYHANSSNFVVSRQSDASYKVIDQVGGYGADVFTGIEKLEFNDQQLNLLSDGTVLVSGATLNGHALSVHFGGSSNVISGDVNSTNLVNYQFSSSSLNALALIPGQGFLIKTATGIDLLSNIDLLSFIDGRLSSSDLFAQHSNLVAPVFHSSAGISGYALPDAYTGPASLGLKWQLIETADNAVVTGSTDNEFIKVASANSIGKAVNGNGGNDVIDGGVGSTFVTGGSGHNDTFFLDGRAPGVSWSTITDFKVGLDKATIWGFVKGVSSIDTSFTNYNNEGAGGIYSGLTFHFKNLLPDGQTAGSNPSLNSITLSGHTLAEFGASSLADLNNQINNGTNAHFIVGATNDSLGTHSYLFVN
jgi:hypothetical protein